MQHYAVLDKIVGVFEAYVPLVDRTVLLKVPGLDTALAPLGESLGFDIGMLKVCCGCVYCIRMMMVAMR